MGAIDPATIDQPLHDGHHDGEVDRVARSLVARGLFVPGLTVGEDGRARSWWWPLPGAIDRPRIARLVTDPSPAGQRSAADALTAAVDAIVRNELVGAGTQLTPRRRGRPTLPQAWMRSLVSTDPELPAWIDPQPARALADEVAAWVRSGAVVPSQLRLCIRIDEPAKENEGWRVELLAQDPDETSLVVPLAEVWEGTSPFGPGAVHEVLASLGRMARLAPELAGLLDLAAPSGVDADSEVIHAILRDRSVPLADAGIRVLLPAWWTHRPRLGARARTKRDTTAGAVTPAGLDMGEIVRFSWEAALDGQRLTKRDLAALAEAARAKRSIVRMRGRWVEVDSSELGSLLDLVGTSSAAPLANLLRAGLGLDDLGTDGAVDVVGVDASGVGWLGSLLDDAAEHDIEPLPTPAGFDGELRPYQERGAGWLVFLGRLGLGACLADDMGLGKTAQLIATLVADRANGPTLVICPVSVLGNWERELARFAPQLDVLVHHGSARHDHDLPFDVRAIDHDVVLSTYTLAHRDLDQLSAVDWGRLVLDEAQQVKNPGTAQAKAVRSLTRRIAGWR